MRRMLCMLIVLGAMSPAWAIDTMTLGNGRVVKGRFLGFTDRKFEFKTATGAVVSEFPVNVKSITPDTPLKVTVDLANNHYEDVEFRSFDEYTLHLAREDETMDERVILLKQLVVNRPPEVVAPPPEPRAPEGGAKEGVRDWRREGKWREMESKNAKWISRGEVVDIEEYLRGGYVNVVHFHYPKSLTSIREGNYVEALAAKASNRMVILKIHAQDFDVPICKELGIKSLPQFWVYDAHGRLVKKLTDRFTEGDIDGALKLAKRGPQKRVDEP